MNVTATATVEGSDYAHILHAAQVEFGVLFDDRPFRIVAIRIVPMTAALSSPTTAIRTWTAEAIATLIPVDESS
jgi:hypothetical protein